MPATVTRNDNVKDGLAQLPQDDESTHALLFHDEESVVQTPSDDGDEQSLAQKIDESVWFYTLYGALDGLTVSYSTVKFLCDVSSKTNNSYHHNLENLLTDSTWLPVLLFETSFVAILSMIGNRASKQKDPQHFHKFCRDYWPYIRDVMRGAKNGYRGIKSLFSVLQHLKIISGEDLRYIAVPVGLAVGAIGLLNRVFIRYMANQRKALSKRLGHIQDKVNQYDAKQFLNKEEALKAKLKLHQEANDSQGIESTLAKLEKLKKEKAQAFQLFQDNLVLHESLSTELKQFEESLKYRLLYASSVIGGLVDGPYFYAGILLLSAIPTPLMAITAGILLCMIVGQIVTRVHEEFEYRRDLKIKSLQTRLLIQQKEYDTKLCEFEAYLKSHREEAEDPEALSRLIIRFDLNRLYSDFSQTDEELTHLLAPSYRDAVILGVKDGLCLFGAISTIYFSVGIFLFLSGAAFPPALIVAAAFIGLGAVMARTAQRVYQTKKDNQNFNAYIHQKKNEKIRLEPYFSYINDCNNDGYTKGQFYFQETFEVVRSLGKGPYKSNNITDFMLSSFKEEQHGGEKKDSLPMVIFCGALSIIYGLCLAIVSYGSGFKSANKKTSNKAPPQEEAHQIVCKKPALPHNKPEPELLIPNDSHQSDRKLRPSISDTALSSSRHSIFHHSSHQSRQSLLTDHHPKRDASRDQVIKRSQSENLLLSTRI